MTALPFQNDGTDAKRSVNNTLINCESVPQHFSTSLGGHFDISRDLILEKGLDRRRSESIALAKARFSKMVFRGVYDLMKKDGYGRESATKVLLGMIRQDDCPPTDNEVLNLMKKSKIGLNDAFTALVVAKAVKRERDRKYLSTCEAIDGITSKLKMNLLISKQNTVFHNSGGRSFALKENERPELVYESQIEIKRNAGKNFPLQSDFSILKKNNKCSSDGKSRDLLPVVKAQNPFMKSVLKATNRKRNIIDEKNSMLSQPIMHNTLNKNDAVDVKLVKKQKLMADEKNIEIESAVRSKNSGSNILRAKRGVANMDDGDCMQE